MPSEASVKFFDETFFQKSFDLALDLIGAQRRKETRETVAKGHAFPGRGRAIRTKDSPLPLILIERAQHTSAGSVAQAIPICVGPKSARGIGCLPNALPEKVWRHARARHSLWHSALPPKENSARSPLCKNTCKTALFPVQYTKALSRFTNTKPKRPKPPGLPREGRSEHQWNPGFSKKT